jgi:hypothetical protein
MDATLITMPFLPRWKSLMLDGTKTQTCRSKAYGQPGDIFRKFGAVFELISVTERSLRDVAAIYYRQEGCHSPHEFVGVWNELHPRRRFIDTDIKWLHEFRRIA